MDGSNILIGIVVILIILALVGITLLLSAVVLWGLCVLFGVTWSWKSLLAVWIILVVISIVAGRS